ncbi:MAG: hypothetical protein MZV70_17000 [Desulfobacterales bacterium]|nr:hypothetical protein [Desulfobacterales bacterium]
MELIDLVNIYAGKFVPVFIGVAVILFLFPLSGGAARRPFLLRTGISLALTLLLLPVVEVKTADPLKAVFEAFFIGAAIGLMARTILGAAPPPPLKRPPSGWDWRWGWRSRQSSIPSSARS